ncbi:hypothetical protein, partial [Stenotrophomonas sp. S39]|uniref:hypothetical protein n=1 Tax=Stenotrophomonas sp. S39 TaxID=2767451 RepID=UPI001F3E9935
SRHPCRSHPLNRTHPASDSFLRPVGTAFCFGGCRPLVGTDEFIRYPTDVPTKVDTYQPPVAVDPRHAWMNSFDI